MCGLRPETKHGSFTQLCRLRQSYSPIYLESTWWIALLDMLTFRCRRHDVVCPRSLRSLSDRSCKIVLCFLLPWSGQFTSRFRTWYHVKVASHPGKHNIRNAHRYKKPFSQRNRDYWALTQGHAMCQDAEIRSFQVPRYSLSITELLPGQFSAVSTLPHTSGGRQKFLFNKKTVCMLFSPQNVLCSLYACRTGYVVLSHEKSWLPLTSRG
jgi:hypothetical protein